MAPVANNFATRMALALVVALAPLAALAALAPWIHGRVALALALAFVAAACASLLAVRLAPLAQFRSVAPSVISAATGAALIAAGYAAIAFARLDVLSGLLCSAGVLLVACAVGASVGTRIQDLGHLLAVALASSAADIWSVHAPEGITRAMVETPRLDLQRLVAVSAAVAPDRAPVAALGAGDVVFAALYLAAIVRHGASRARVVAALAIGLALAGAGTFAAHRPLPALPFLGAAVVLAEPRARRIARRDRFATAIAGVILLAAVVRVMA